MTMERVTNELSVVYTTSSQSSHVTFELLWLSWVHSLTGLYAVVEQTPKEPIWRIEVKAQPIRKFMISAALLWKLIMVRLLLK